MLASNQSIVAHSISVSKTIQEAYVVPHAPVLTSLFDEHEERTGTETYEVLEGDTLSAIAVDYGLTMQTLLVANNLKNPNALKPGTELKIPPINGLLHMVKKGDTVSSLAKKYTAESEKIIAFNGLPQEGDLQIGTELMIPDGRPPAQASTTAVRNISSRRFSTLPNLNSYFTAPTTGRLTQRKHGRNGCDIANIVGTQIYAAAGGTVKLSDGVGYNGGYGKYVLITHPNGTETLYAHLSKILVGAGETVESRQYIGNMGSTGRSTGSHLHFEVHNAQNPLCS